MQNILVCDDDQEIVDAISIYLQAEGFNVVKCYDGSEVHDILQSQPIDLLIMDVMMPKEDGITTIHKIRSNKNNIPIILLSAKSEDNDKILGLNIGADDYMTKPFNPLELIARVKSKLRNTTPKSELVNNPDIITIGDLELNLINKTVKLDGAPIKLTPIEFDIISLLAQNRGQIFSITDIYEKIWNSSSISAENTVAVHIRHIREKIEQDAKNPQYIKVIWGRGYKID